MELVLMIENLFGISYTIMKKLPKIYLTFLCFLGCLTMNGQNIAGEWNGVMNQDAGGIAAQYYFSLHLKQNGKKITGFSKVELY